MKHTHRIVPGHMGGEYAEGNTIEVEIVECNGQRASHAMWHFALWQLYGKMEDWFAWKGLAGHYGKEEIIALIKSETGRKGGGTTYSTRRGIWGMPPEEKKAAERKGGKTSGEKFKREKIGVCGIPPEEHSARMGNTNKQKWKCPECDYVSNARWMNAHMLKEHNLSSNAKVKW